MSLPSEPVSKENLPGYHRGVPATVLIVDDERNIQVTLARALALEGYQTEAVGTGAAALERIAELPVDLVLLDVKLPTWMAWRCWSAPG